MPAYLLANLIVISAVTGSLCAEEWPHKKLNGAWLVTYASSDGEEVEQAKGNMLVFHNNQMIFAFDRNYGPPNPELGAIGFKFHGMTTTHSKSYGLTRVPRGGLKFMLEHNERDGNDSIAVRIEDYPQNRVVEIVQYKAQRMDIEEAVRRIRWLLGSPKYEDGADARTDAVDALEDWLHANEIGEPSDEPQSPSRSDFSK